MPRVGGGGDYQRRPRGWGRAWGEAGGGAPTSEVHCHLDSSSRDPEPSRSGHGERPAASQHIPHPGAQAGPAGRRSPEPLGGHMSPPSLSCSLQAQAELKALRPLPTPDRTRAATASSRVTPAPLRSFGLPVHLGLPAPPELPVCPALGSRRPQHHALPGSGLRGGDCGAGLPIPQSAARGTLARARLGRGPSVPFLGPRTPAPPRPLRGPRAPTPISGSCWWRPGRRKCHRTSPPRCGRSGRRGGADPLGAGP